MKLKKLTLLLESGFDKTLSLNYFEKTLIHKAYITYCYRAAAIITLKNGVPFLDKFVVADSAKGEGLGKALWDKLSQQHPQLFWRCKPDNAINGFYFKNASGCYKTQQWNTFWYGLTDFQQIENCVSYALSKTATLN